MQKAKELVNELVDQYNRLSLKKKPKLNLQPGFQDSIKCEYAGGAITLIAGERNLCFALHQLIVALKSGHIGEYLGLMTPRFPLRLMEPPCDAKQLCLFGFSGVIVDKGADFTPYKSYGLKVYEKQSLPLCPLSADFVMPGTSAD